MGNSSSQSQSFIKEKKTETVDASLYYFAGRGRADQVFFFRYENDRAPSGAMGLGCHWSDF
jgi:hypothetical protein